MCIAICVLLTYLFFLPLSAQDLYHSGGRRGLAHLASADRPQHAGKGRQRVERTIFIRIL